VSIEIVPLCTVHATLAEPIVFGAGAAGMRLLYEVTGATFEGERLRGHMRGSAGGDWVVVNGTVGTIDVRMTAETHDGALILVQYNGRTNLAEQPMVIRVAPRFETGDERYAWLNAVQAVGRGTMEGTSLTYEWYEVK
jgi:hypothetical protein